MRLIFAVLCFYVFGSCSAEDRPADLHTSAAYFSLDTYFREEAKRLSHLTPLVEKKVMQNQEEEHKTLEITDWIAELELFMQSDINKTAWIGQYHIDSLNDGETVRYTTQNTELKTRSIDVSFFESGAVKHISVLNKTDNMLYETQEILDYYPDSLYRIDIIQRVRYWSDNSYHIVGRFTEKQ